MTDSPKTTSASTFWGLLIAMALALGFAPLGSLSAQPPATDAARSAVVAASSSLPSDVPEWHQSPTSELPELPEEFIREQHGDVEWAFPPSGKAVARELQRQMDEASRKARQPFGLQSLGPLSIRIAKDGEQLAALAPENARPPAYAVGVAYPQRRLILLSLRSPTHWGFPKIDRILVHELAHLALFQATNKARLPMWFIEGLAVQQAGENDLARIRTLAVASMTNSLLGLDQVSRRFPHAPHRVNVAYAQSADMVGYLMSREDGRPFSALLQRLREGVPFERAVRAAYGAPLSAVMAQWRSRAFERFRTFPLVLSGSLVWVFGILLLLLAYLKRRRQHRQGIAKMAREEEQNAQQLVIRVVNRPSPPPKPHRPDLDDYIIRPPPTGETEVPTVEYEGQNHTLH